MNKINWAAIITFIVVALLVILVGISLLGGWGYGGWGMMGGRLGGGMMGGYRFSPFGWIGMIFMWLVPVGLAALAIAGIVWLVRTASNPGGQPVSTRSCPNCGKSCQADWRNCPYCGQALQ